VANVRRPFNSPGALEIVSTLLKVDPTNELGNRETKLSSVELFFMILTIISSHSSESGENLEIANVSLQPMNWTAGQQ
jgi:hypothetical protein